MRFIVDIVAAKDLVASLVVAETFPGEQHRLRIKNGEDSDALLAGIRSYTLLRLHELVPGRSRQAICASIAARNTPMGGRFVVTGILGLPGDR